MSASKQETDENQNVAAPAKSMARPGGFAFRKGGFPSPLKNSAPRPQASSRSIPKTANSSATASDVQKSAETSKLGVAKLTVANPAAASRPGGLGFGRRPTKSANGSVTNSSVSRRVSATPGTEKKLEEIKGRIIRVIFHAADSGYTVLAARIHGEKKDATIQVTTGIKVNAGDKVRAHGEWTTYKGKPQFKADMIQMEIPEGAKGVAEWLRNGAVQGVAQGTIRKMIKAFGEDIQNVIGDAEALAEVIPQTKADAIAKAWNSNANQPQLVTALFEVGLKPKQIARVIEQYGAAAMKKIETNPWEFVETIEGIGFPTADQIARAKGLSMTSAKRIMTGLDWVLNESLNRDGHCGIPKNALLSNAVDMLQVPEEVVEHSFNDFLDGVNVVEDTDVNLVYSRSLWDAENDLADKLAALQCRPFRFMDKEEAESLLEETEAELGIRLDRDGGQIDAATMVLSNGVSIITGGPGTGKSTTQRAIVKALSDAGKRVALAAPTGRASKRLSETSGQDAQTLHRLLVYSPMDGCFVHNEDNPLKIDVVIVDEFSMVDIRLAASVVSALPPHAMLLMVGDFDQLPSVGPGQVLRDLILSEVLPVARLTRVHRQAEGSGIAIAAHRINTGLTPMDPEDPMRGFSVINKKDHEAIDEVIRLVRFELPEMGFDPMKDVQILTSMKVGDVGTEALNIALKSALNPASDDINHSVTLIKKTFSIGDRIMQMRNDYQKGVYNGEVGTVIAVGEETNEDGKKTKFLKADFDGVEAMYLPSEVDDIELAYAATVHKSQGCEFPVVIFVAAMSHRRMLNRNLLYTGVTRSRTECIIVGEQNAIERAVETADSFRRHTGLQYRIMHAMEELKEAA